MTTWHEYVQRNGRVPEWPYPVNYGKVNEVVTDVLVIGGGCVEECPRPGAITMLHPTQQRISMNWKRQDTGELFRLGMKNPPPPNTRPPSG
ncbi:MAG: hypothetical protein KAW90_08065 [Dehalococcoidales bacterium]|nr:hypothetical protein [Dehalococcoidales bacterium]